LTMQQQFALSDAFIYMTVGRREGLQCRRATHARISLDG
jgi:hypothetical protein